MKDGGPKSFEQCYNCQAAVDDANQIIVAMYVTQQANDKQQMELWRQTIIRRVLATPVALDHQRVARTGVGLRMRIKDEGITIQYLMPLGMTQAVSGEIDRS